MISSKVHIRITFIKLSPKFEYGFSPINENQDGHQTKIKMVAKIAAACQFALVDTLTEIFYKFHKSYFNLTLTQVRIWIFSDE